MGSVSLGRTPPVRRMFIGCHLLYRVEGKTMLSMNSVRRTTVGITSVCAAGTQLKRNRTKSFTPTLAIALFTLCVSIPRANAQNLITDLFNTGVDSSGNKVSPTNTTTADLHYQVVATTGTSSVTAYVEQSPFLGGWTSNSVSNYLSPDGVEGDGTYTATYETTFHLPSEANLSAVNISGGWSTDNYGNDILINGHSTGFVSNAFNTFTSFTLPTGYYQSGINTIDFAWGNQGGPGGIDVYFTTASYSTTSSTPEPGSVAMLSGFGLTAISVFAKRRRK